MMKINYTRDRRMVLSIAVFLMGCLLVPIPLFAQQASITIEQKVAGNIFYQNDQKEFVIHVTADSVEWDCYDFWDQKILSGKKAVAGDTALLNIEPGKLGWFKLLIKSKQNSAVTGSKETSFAIVSNFDLSAVSQSAFIGQTHAWQSTDILIPIAKKMGVKYVRDAIRWDAVEKQKQVYTFGTKEDNFIAQLAANNLKPYLVCALYNPLYDNGKAPVSAEGKLAFANYVKQLLTKYPSIENVEIWNEPDIATFSQGLTTEDQKTTFYYNLLKASYDEVHPTFPNVKIVGMVVSDLATESFLNKILQKGALSLMNEYAFHSYIPVSEAIVTDINKHKNVIKAHNNNNLIPINLSETGFTIFTFTEKEQANNLPRRIVAALANGVQKIGIYNLQNKSTVNDSEGAFGLIRHPDDTLGAYTPKPGFATYAALTRQLSGATFVAEEQISPGLINAYKFIKGSEEIRVMYSLSGTGVRLFTDAASLEVVDIMGNSTVYNAVKDTVSITLDANPVYIKGVLKAPFAQEKILPATVSFSLKYGFYFGGYTEVTQDSVAAAKWISAIAEIVGHDGKRTRVVAKPAVQSKATWKAAITKAGQYNISVYIPANAALNAYSTTKAKYTIFAGGTEVAAVIVDQFKDQGKWVNLGSYQLPRGTNNYVELTDTLPAHDRPLRADALKFTLTP
ncbi:hypothetical protein H9N25_02245 [Pedobacter riviphilus]|uniref:Golvesin/Xly CBD-like domain-containing protein n=1 Tax=Pedobacter riviphilus TaxID=2766984 RepID=A0ABX6TIN1_9SPHI|nr:hypothetical protein [Pedobacter riviphilus]QNR85328.1 hypothetical protein H9N25_02245 [Pedobacter riviphilus]